jgi:hypothetical protein
VTWRLFRGFCLRFILPSYAPSWLEGMASPGSPVDKNEDKEDQSEPAGEEDYGTLKYQLLGPSLTKAGQDAVDQQKVRAK